MKYCICCYFFLVNGTYCNLCMEEVLALTKQNGIVKVLVKV